MSRESFMIKGCGVLQLLTKNHIRLFHLLGKTSGRDVDKIASIKEKGYNINNWSKEAVLGDAACYLAIKAASDYIPCGDHDVSRGPNPLSLLLDSVLQLMKKKR